MASSSSSLSSSFNDLPETRFVVTHSDKNDAEQQGENSNNHHNHAGILDVGRIAAAPVGATTTASVSSRTTSSNHNSNNNRDLEYYGGQPLQQRDEDDEEDRFHDIPVSKSAEERDCMAAAEHSTKAYRENRNASDHQTTSYHSNSLSRFLLRPSLLLFGGRSNTNNSSATEEETEGSDSEIPVHHMECSLPTVEELRHQHERMDSNNTNNKKQPCDDDNHPKEQQSTTRRRRKRSAVLWILLLLVVLVLVAAVVLRTTTNKTKLDEAVAFLTHCNVSSIEALQTPTSPQAQAIQWLTYDDSYNLAVPSYSLQHQHSTTMAAHMLITNDTETNRYIARYTLVLAYFALSGPTWWFQLDFLTAQHECDWHSPLVNAAESHFGVHCDSDQRPVHLRLRNNNMKGEIPSEIGLLTTLQYFDWGINLLDGGLPTSLCLLSKLTSLNVGENSLRGSLPYCLGQLTLLEQLDVHDNRLSGSLPGPSRSPLSLSSTHHHTNTTMQAMKRLFLSTNTFTGDPSPFWNDMTRLEIIMAGTNRFTAEINDEFLQNHVRLTWLDLSNNDFMLHGGTSRFSSIPAHLFEMSHLQVLDLSKNRLIGTIPSELKENNIMRYLSVYDNHLHSTVEQLKQLRSLHHLDVSRNALEGTLPPSFSQLSDLRLLFVGDNSFTANIVPTEWSTFLHLHELSLRQSRRNGTFDSENLPLSLVYLDLGSNELSGDLPTNMGNDFPHLEFLMLNDNSNITGELPETFKLMNKLSAVFLDGTGINGNVELVCELPNFVNENGHEIAFADCSEKYDDDQEFPFECDCCQCCEHNDLKNGCSIPYQANLKQAWARDFQTLSYTITNETVLLNREYIPPYIKT